MKKEKRNLYEGMFIVSASLSEEARKKALDKITVGITSRGGEINQSHDWGRRKLAYEINRHREGCYYILYFTLPASAMSDLWREWQLNEDLIRFMTLQAEEVKTSLEFKTLAPV